MMETTSSSGAPSMATIPEAVVRQASLLKSPSGGAASNGGSNSTSTTPFIKRKCLSKEMALKENACSNASPFVIQSVKMDSTSPKLLNDRFASSFHLLRKLLARMPTDIFFLSVDFF